MPLHSFPQIRTLSLTLVILFAAFVIDLNLKRISVQYDFGSVPHRLLTQAYSLLAARLVHQTEQPQPSADASVAANQQKERKLSLAASPKQ